MNPEIGFVKFNSSSTTKQDLLTEVIIDLNIDQLRQLFDYCYSFQDIKINYIKAWRQSQGLCETSLSFKFIKSHLLPYDSFKEYNDNAAYIEFNPGLKNTPLTLFIDIKNKTASFSNHNSLYDDPVEFHTCLGRALQLIKATKLTVINR